MRSLKDAGKDAKLDRAAGSGHGLRDTSISQDKEEESTEQIRIRLCFLTIFLAEVWEKRGSRHEN